MSHNKKRNSNVFLKEKKVDLVFSGVALILIITMVVFLVHYASLRRQNQAKPEEYGTAMQELNDAKNEKNELESKIDVILQQIQELNRKISSLGGN